MRVNQSTSTNQVKTSELPLELKVGEVYSVKIKEKVSDKEAIVQIRGKDMPVQFEGKVPSGERATVQITEGRGELTQVRLVSVDQGSAVGDQDVSTVLRSMGVSATPELKQATKILLDKGVPLSKESIRNVKEFLEKEPGDLQQKLETIHAIANKKLDVSITQLRSVHEALHGRSLSNVLSDLEKNTGQTSNISLQNILNNMNAIVKDEQSLDKAIQQIRAQLSNNPNITPEVVAKIEKALLDAEKLQHAGHERIARESLMKSLEQVSTELDRISSQGQPAKVVGSQTNLQMLINMVRQEPSLEHVVQQFQELFGSRSNANSAAVAKIEKSLAQAVSLQSMGWEQVGRDQVLKTIDQVGPDLLAGLIEDEAMNNANGQNRYDANIDLQMGALLSTKDLVVTEISAKLSQAASHFQTVKREVTRNIDNIIQVAQMNQGNILSGVKPLLETTIDLLDKAILKSEITMLTDMETEKQIMKASSQLAEARRLLTKGENTQAMAIMNEVKSKLDSLQWRPSNVRIQHFMTTDSIFSGEVPAVHKLSDQIGQLALQNQSHEPSARNTFEFFRALGLNYESEVAQALSSGQQGGNDDLHKNLKAALLQLAKTEDVAQPSLSNQNQQVEKALNNLTGQQLLSKSDTGSNLQNMFFQLPVMLGGSLESAKLYVNSKNEGQKVDWENCSLYFLIETKKMGQTGIYISAVDRNLSITIKNNQPNIKDKVETIVSKCKDNLKEIGYNISGVTFTKLTEEAKAGVQRQQSQPPTQTTLPNTFAKGLDFKI